MLIVALLVTTASAAPSQSGRFERAQPTAQVDQICAAAVEDAVGSLAWLIRPIARPRLKAVATACPAYRFDIQGDQFEVQCDGKPAFAWTVGKAGTWTSDDGEVMTVHLDREGEALVLDFAGQDGGKSFTYEWDTEGALRVTQRVRSDHLPAPMTWTLAYSRSE